jgi:hypothetical protein
MDWLSDRLYSEDAITHKEFMRHYTYAETLTDVSGEYRNKRNFIIHVYSFLV